MKEVKRYTLTDYGYDGLCCDNPEKGDAFDSLRKNNSVVVVTASDFDAVLKELEGKLKVAVAHIHHHHCCAMITKAAPCNCGYHEALALLDKEG